MESALVKNDITIGLLGQPNTGKSTLFNSLTGGKQHVGNWPGKTVEQKSGKLHNKDDIYHIVDLPGTYSLSANSEEELITRDFVFSDKGDVIVTLIDASQLERSMYLLADFVGVNIPVVAVLNMVDVAEQNGKIINFKIMERNLGIPIIPMVATKKKGIPELINNLEKSLETKKYIKTDIIQEKYRKAFGGKFDSILNILPEEGIGNYSAVWIAVKLLENDKQIIDIMEKAIDSRKLQEINSIISDKGNDGALIAANCKYEWINHILDGAIKEDKKQKKKMNRFDKVATHPILGKSLAILMMVLGFAISMGIAMPFMIGIFKLVPAISYGVQKLLLEIEVSMFIISLISEAVIPAAFMALLMGIYVSGVSLVFGFMEDIGYMARVAYVFDGIMSKAGLHGKAVMPFVMSFGCNMAGITGARVIDSWKQRLLTIATSLVIPCAGMWGVTALMSTLFFGKNAVWIIISLFILTIIHIMLTSWILRKILKEDEDSTGLIMELPPYHRPNWKTIFSYVWNKIKVILSKAFKVIMGVSIAIWILSYSSDGNIEGSLIYAVGKFIEPVGALFGLDWRLFIAFVVSAMGKEASLGVISMLFGVGGGISSFTGAMVSGAAQFSQTDLSTVMLASISKPMALAFVFAFFFNIPCMAAIACVNVETNSSKWTIKIVTYYMVTALIIGGIAYRIGSIIF